MLHNKVMKIDCISSNVMTLIWFVAANGQHIKVGL